MQVQISKESIIFLEKQNSMAYYPKIAAKIYI